MNVLFHQPRYFISGDNVEEAGAKENLYLPSCYSAHYPRIIGIVFAKSDMIASWVAGRCNY